MRDKLATKPLLALSGFAGFIAVSLLALLLCFEPLATRDAAARDASPDNASAKDAAGKDASGCALSKSERLKVRSIVDGDTLVLEDGRQVRLVGTQAPKLPLGRKNFPTWPLAPQSASKLSAMTSGQMVTLKYGGARIDRHGRVLAHLFLDDGTWVQRAMVAAGMARFYSFADNRQCTGALLSAEQAARSAGRGIWADPFYAIRRAEDVASLEKLVGTFQLVEGRVHDAEMIRGRLYLNFGADWRDDFTVTVPPTGVKLFAKGAWADLIATPSRLVGQKIRVRGWIDSFNGPQIEASHPEQIEVLNQ